MTNHLLDEVGLAPLAPDLGRVESRLRDAVSADDRFLGEAAGHLLAAGGKRLRPALCLGAAYAVSGRVPGALGRAVHDAATNAFIHGLSVSALVAGGVAAAGAILAVVFLPAQPASPAVTPPPVPAASPAEEAARF